MATQDGKNVARNLSVAGIQMCVDKGEDQTDVMIKKWFPKSKGSRLVKQNNGSTHSMDLHVVPKLTHFPSVIL
jgi:hypothetical protein